MKRIHSIFLTSILTTMLLITAGASQADENYACSCTGIGTDGACGNDAIGGDNGDIFTDVSADAVKNQFQTNANTGWTCVIPAKVRGSGEPLGCFCAELCGNGGIGADPNYFDLGLSQATVDSSYGGGKPGNKTGWLCGKYRGDFSN